MSMRKTMMKELRQITEANPVFRGKLKHPSIKSRRLHNLITQSLNWQHKQCKNSRPNPVINTLFVDHVCEPQEYVPLPLPIENNLEDCLSLSLSTGNSLQVRYVLPSQATSNPLPTSSAEPKVYLQHKLKSTVTDPGQSHMCHTQWFAHYCCLTLHEGSSPMSMDFHPTWQTILPFGTCVGDIGPPWDVSSGEKLLSRNFRVWNLDAGPMALKEALVKDSYASVNHIRWSPDGSIFGENVLILKCTLCNYILIMEATTIGKRLHEPQLNQHLPLQKCDEVNIEHLSKTVSIFVLFELHQYKKSRP
ncbi:unnamed protein product [Prunus armeniaca]